MVIKSGFEKWIRKSNKIDLQKEWHNWRFINRNKNNEGVKTEPVRIVSFKIVFDSLESGWDT